MTEPLTAQQILSVLMDCQRVIRGAGPKPCGMRLSEHEFLLKRLDRAQETVAAKIAEAKR